jgi:hypothetical protein
VTELDRASLDRILPSASASPDWGDVIGRTRAHQSRRRRRLVALAAAALVVAVGTASAFGTVRHFFLAKGFIGLPPVAATPSTPEGGELVIFYWVNADWNHLGRSRAWVYADGRLIWLREKADLPEGANRFSTGFLEQRLTREGVELLRSEIISTGQLGHTPPPPPLPAGVSAPPPLKGEPVQVPFGTEIQVRNAGRLVSVDRPSDLKQLVVRLIDPASWLPASAWERRELRAYVPTKFAVCYGGWPPDQPIEPSRILSLLPVPAEDLLRAKDRTRTEGRFGSPGHFHVVSDHCSDVTSEEARALAATFDAAGFERFMPAVRLAYRFETPGPNEETVHIYFEPYLPHGERICSACG